MNIMLEHTGLFNWVILPLCIYLARVADVSLGTMRIITVSRGLRRIAPLLGFVEMLIWLLAIRQIFNNLNNPLCYLAYASGFASGIYSGMWIENRVALGLRVIRIITRYDAQQLIGNLRELGFGVTTIDAEGGTGPVKLVFTVVKRRDVVMVTQLAKKLNPNAFLSVGDIHEASEAVFPNNGHSSAFGGLSRLWRFERKGK